MTNVEKFEQTFGFVPRSEVCTLPDSVCKRISEKNGKNTSDVCAECPFVDWWNDEYKKGTNMDFSKFPWVIVKNEQLPGQMSLTDVFDIEGMRT